MTRIDYIAWKSVVKQKDWLIKEPQVLVSKIWAELNGKDKIAREG